MFTLRFTLTVMALLFCSALAFAQDKTVVLSYVEGRLIHSAGQAILKGVYEQLGYEVLFKPLPTKRALIEANSGITDGDVARIALTEQDFTNLVPVPTPILQTNIYVFSKNIERDVQSWDDISDLKIGVLRGVRYGELATEGMDRVFFDNYEDMMNLLSLDRIDVVVGVLEQANSVIEESFPDSNIHPLGEPIFQIKLYHYVHLKNEALVPELDRVLQEMSESGMLERVYKSFF